MIHDLCCVKDEDRFRDAPAGLIVGAEYGLFRYNGTRTIRVDSDRTGGIHDFRDTPTGLLLGADNGLFRYDGTRTIRVEGDPTRMVYKFHDTPRGVLLNAQNGLFRYDGTRTNRAQGDPMGATRLASSVSFTTRRPGCFWARTKACSASFFSRSRLRRSFWRVLRSLRKQPQARVVS